MDGILEGGGEKLHRAKEKRISQFGIHLTKLTMKKDAMAYSMTMTRTLLMGVISMRLRWSRSEDYQ